MYCKIHQLHGTDIPLLDAARERGGVDGIEVSVYREVVVQAMKKTMWEMQYWVRKTLQQVLACNILSSRSKANSRHSWCHLNVITDVWYSSATQWTAKVNIIVFWMPSLHKKYLKQNHILQSTDKLDNIWHLLTFVATLSPRKGASFSLISFYGAFNDISCSLITWSYSITKSEVKDLLIPAWIISCPPVFAVSVKVLVIWKKPISKEKMRNWPYHEDKCHKSQDNWYLYQETIYLEAKKTSARGSLK